MNFEILSDKLTIWVYKSNFKVKMSPLYPLGRLTCYLLNQFCYSDVTQRTNKEEQNENCIVDIVICRMVFPS